MIGGIFLKNLKELPIWVNWNQEKWTEEKTAGIKSSKPPINSITGRYAEPNDPTTWTSYETALTAAPKYGNGVGFMFDPNSGICGIDIDVKGCPEKESQAQEILTHFKNTYAEYSPSEDGYHIIFTCDLSKIPQQNGKLHPLFYQKNPGNSLECYFAGLTNRYFTYTGKVTNDKDVTEQTQQVLEFLEMYMKKNSPSATKPKEGEKTNKPSSTTILSNYDLIEKARNAKNGTKFSALFDHGDLSAHKGDESAADLALCNILAFWLGGDFNAIDEVFRSSALYREKWNREDYRTKTINDAIARCSGNFFRQKTKPTGGGGRQERPKKDNPLDGQLLINQINPFDKPSRYTWDALGLRLLFADTYKDVARYVPESKEWYVYNGKVWQKDVGGLYVQRFAVDLIEHLLDCRKNIKDEQLQEVWLRFITNNMAKKHRDVIIKDSASVYPVSINEFDKNPFILNCQNCTLDLMSMKQNPHRAEDYLTKITNVSIDLNAKCNRWIKFIDEVMQNDMDKAKFLQKALGYTLTGDISHECFFLLYGSTTRNGKGTTMETILHMLGSYGRTAQPESIAQKQSANGSGPSEDIARLKGARFVNMSEPDKGLRLNSALVKQMTGGDTLTARFLHENSFEFRPEYKLFINTNHLPKVNDDSIFASGRVKLIPFDRHFKDSEQDKRLKNFFKQPDNLSGILNWCIHGLQIFNSEGLEQPKAVIDATIKYREESNPVGQFINEELTKVIGSKTEFKIIYAKYCEWCDTWGFGALNRRNFADTLKMKEMKIAKSDKNKTFLFNYEPLNSSNQIPDEFTNE